MEALWSSGRIIDGILLIVVLEAVLLHAYRKRTGKGPVTTDWLPNLLSGAALMITIRLALTDAHWLWLSVGVTLALVAHITDLRLRWR